MYTLYIANKNYSSWSLRPWALMRMLGIPFEEKLVPLPDGGAWEKYREFSPSGRVPALKDGNVTVWDSLAIVEYLAERHPGVWPADAGVRAWARSAAAEMHSGFVGLRSNCTMNCGIRVTLRERTPAMQADLARVAELWAEGLTRWGGPFLTGGRFTAVDAFYTPIAFRIQTYGLELDPAAAGYSALLLRQAPMQEWYEAALRETLRVPKYDADAHALGVWTADLRATA
ncbi:glutathione S-transferase family protein [Devosia sp.]|uniref:glutathione S-transferase family protein n=1 Tax=Devosia sp. TaxID=1871048 RepID=UPI002F16DB09